jgi:DNA polymerase-3 subunit alpha
VFIPLHIYSAYTFLSSGFTIDRLISALKEKGYTSAALTDKNVLFGIPDFFTLAKKQGITPLAGLDILFENFALTLFAKTEQGYRTLMMVSTLVSKQSLDRDFFTQKNLDILVVINPAQSQGFQGDDAALALTLKKLFSGIQQVYIGIPLPQTTHANELKRYRDFANRYPYPAVAFPHIRYPKAQDAIVIDILDAINQGKTLTIREKQGPDYLPDLAELQNIYTEAERLQTVEIANLIQFNFFVKRGHLLQYPTSSSSSHETLREWAIEGLQQRAIDFSNIAYLTRLDFELTTIEQLGFSDYFLIVSDFVKYAKAQRIPVGPGRGSAPGSLVAYALHITDIDPIPHGLLFERFLNPSRKTMPDIDIDIADVDREKIITYLKGKYGDARVAHIITYQTIQAKQAIRDIGRVYQFSQTSVEQLSKSLGDGKLDLRQSYKKLPAFQNLFDKDQECADIVRLAHKIEGFIRQSGLHAAGIILNQDPLDQVLPLIAQDDKYITQYEMNYLEAQGFLKIDILGLRNLTIIQSCLQSLLLEGINVSLATIPLDDPAVFSVLKRGLNMGIFQLESEGMKKAMMLIQPSSFADIVSLIALYRPGPMDHIESYANRKKGLEPVAIFDPILKDILTPTYGIIIYQEQIMQIAQKMAGFTLARADDFRRAISKKDLTAMTNLKSDFIQGAITQGYKQDHAMNVYNLIVKFADYGFNKSHSVAYATITYHMAYLKTYYPHAFYLAILNSTASTSDTKMGQYLDEIRQLKLTLAPPSIDKPFMQFTLEKNTLIAPLTMIKGISNEVCKRIEHVVKKGTFKDFNDCVIRLYDQVNANQLLALIDAGALDRLHASRATLRASFDILIKSAKVQATFIDEQTGLLPGEGLPKINLIAREENHLENIEREIDVLGMVLSQSILGTQKSYRGFPNLISIRDAKQSQQQIGTGGMIRQVRVIQTKAGQAMAFATLYDETDTLDLVIFPKLYAAVGPLLERGKLVIVSGTIDKDKPSTLLVEQIQGLQR